MVLPMRQRAEVINGWLEQRLDRIVPDLMREHGLDMWIVLGREYNEDPVLKTMLPATWLSARRRTILVFFDPGNGEPVERLAVARYSVGRLFESAWDPEEQPDQWARLAEIIEERNPKNIGINTSETYAHADGLSHTQHESLKEALSPRFRSRLVSAEPVAIGWLERRLPEEMEVYSSVCRIAHEIMAEALSERVVQPGVTTKSDIEWWCRERVRELKLTAWFQPSIIVQRRASDRDYSFDLSEVDDPVIRRGDLIRLDFGITYLRLSTDTQQVAYVLLPGETEPPAGLQRAFDVGNEMEDILTSRFAVGRTGNEVLLSALAEAESRGIKGMVYTHPIGFHGHGAGPAIGMWDKQGGVPGTGDYPLYDGTAYSIELNVTVPIPDWDNQDVRIMLEEDAFFKDGRVRYIDGRQTELFVIR
ncbi:MAG: M24 family metallopeptidase [Planctomycetota bacterium]